MKRTMVVRKTKKRRYEMTGDEVGGVLVEDVEVLCD